MEDTQIASDEEEANIFACLLLMPKELFEKDVSHPFDLGDDNLLFSLSEKYQVPANAVVYRMQLLNKYNI